MNKAWCFVPFSCCWPGRWRRVMEESDWQRRGGKKKIGRMVNYSSISLPTPPSPLSPPPCLFCLSFLEARWMLHIFFCVCGGSECNCARCVPAFCECVFELCFICLCFVCASYVWMVGGGDWLVCVLNSRQPVSSFLFPHSHAYCIKIVMHVGSRGVKRLSHQTTIIHIQKYSKGNTKKTQYLVKTYR